MIELRPVGDADLETLEAWFRAPHVIRWWRDETAGKYLPEARGDDPTEVRIAIYDRRPLGLVQWYLWDDNVSSRDAYGIPAGTVGIDYLIGHPHDCDKGLGTAVVAALVEATPSLPIWVTPEEANEPSCRVLEKNGFERMAVKQCHVPDEPLAGPTALYRLQR